MYMHKRWRSSATAVLVAFMMTVMGWSNAAAATIEVVNKSAISAEPSPLAGLDSAQKPSSAIHCAYPIIQKPWPSQAFDRYVRCPTPYKVQVNYYGGGKGPIVCRAPNVQIHLGHNDGISEGDPGDMLTPEYGSATELGSCSQYDDVVPRDKLNGQVVAERHQAFDSGERAPLRPLRGGRWELWYKGKAGNATDAVEWRPVRKSFNPATWAPEGDPLLGYLDNEGRFDDTIGTKGIDFVYPQTFQLANGTTWHGCEAAVPPVPHLRGSACADDKMSLRFFPETQGGTVQVMQPGGGGSVPLAYSDEIKVGEHFKAGHASVHELISAGAHTFAAYWNVKDAFPRLEFLRINLITPGGGSAYDPFFQTVRLETSDAETSTAEHEIGHALHHDLVGIWDLVDPDDNCSPHRFARRSSAECAWSEGFANWVAVVSENELGQDGWEKLTSDWGYNNVEECWTISSTVRADCEEGETVEGRVTATLWDLLDRDSEYSDGFKDESAPLYSSILLESITQVVSDSSPDEFNQFWESWIAAQGDADSPASFLNGLNILGVLNDSDADVTTTGAWASAACSPVAQCRGGSISISAPTDSGIQSARWNLSPILAANSENLERWDVWVNIPDSDGLDWSAQYSVQIGDSVQSFTIDQGSYRGLWAKISPPEGFASVSSTIPVTVTLTGSSQGSEKIAIDALVVSPRS